MSAGDKRPREESEDTEEVETPPPAKQQHVEKANERHICNYCMKEFRRACDLRKHEKVHLRPWKCTDESCKYYKLGWPTEKERDRHVNDKHSDEPSRFTCHFQPCTYTSKRESNLKQHMEKMHGWEYQRTRTKGNVRNHVLAPEDKLAAMYLESLRARHNPPQPQTSWTTINSNSPSSEPPMLPRHYDSPYQNPPEGGSGKSSVLAENFLKSSYA